MANNPISTPLPADLPTNWVYGQTIAPRGTDVGLSQQHGYNYLSEQINAAQEGVNTIGNAFTGLVPTSTTVNEKALSNDITLTAEDVGAIRAAAPYSVVTEADLDTWIDTQCLCAPASSGTLRTLMGSRCYVTQLFYNGVGTSYSRCQIAWGYTTTNIAYRYYYVSGSSGSWSEWGQVYTSTSGYGLGGNVKVAAGQDANQITATGFYSCDTNTPTSEWYFGYHIQRGDAYAYQRFIHSFSFEIYERQKTAGEWSAWEKTWPLAQIQIQTGTYTGTGTYGVSNPNTLTFGFTPKIVWISGSNTGTGGNVAGNSLGWIYENVTGLSLYTGGAGTATNNLTWSTTGLSWYNTMTADGQLNEANGTYRWVAIG